MLHLAKFLLAFLTPLTENQCTVTDTFHFVEDICKQHPNFHMATLDVDPLFTNIPLDITIDICIDSLYKDNENTLYILKNVSPNFLNIPTKNHFLCLTLHFINKLMV